MSIVGPVPMSETGANALSGSMPSLRSVIDRANVLRQSGPEGPRDLPDTRPQTVPSAQNGDEEPEGALEERPDP